MAAAIWFATPIPWFTLLAAGWGAGAVYEFYSLVKRSKGSAPLVYFGTLWVVLLIISPHFQSIPHLNDVQPASLLVTASVIVPLLILKTPGIKSIAVGARLLTLSETGRMAAVMFTDPDICGATNSGRGGMRATKLSRSACCLSLRGDVSARPV